MNLLSDERGSAHISPANMDVAVTLSQTGHGVKNCADQTETRSQFEISVSTGTGTISELVFIS